MPPAKVASTAERLGIDVSTKKKSILKHRTLTEILQTPTNVSPPKKSESESPSRNSDQHQGMVRANPAPSHVRNKTLKLGSFKSNPSHQPAKKERHISFNTVVSQCIALDDDTSDMYKFDDDYSDTDDEKYDENDCKTSGSRIAQCLSSPKRAGRHATIALMPPTHLKMGHEVSSGSDPEDSIEGGLDGHATNEHDARYSVADPFLAAHDHNIVQDDGYDYYDSDEDYELEHAPSLGPDSAQNTSGSQGTFD